MLLRPRSWPAPFPPSTLIAATAILGVVLAVATVRNLDRERHMMGRFLLQEGLTVIRALEAGTRTSLRMMPAAPSPLEVLLEETAASPAVAFVALLDHRGRLIASAGNPGELPGPEDVRAVLAAPGPVSEMARDGAGEEVFVVARAFSPVSGPGPMHARWQQWCGMGSMGAGHTGAGQARQAMFVGLYTRDFAAARAEDVRQSLLLGGVLLLVGTAGFYALLLSQRVRSARAAVRDMESYTRHVVESLPDALVTLDGEDRVVSMNARAEELFGVPGAAAAGRPFGDLAGDTACDIEPWVRRGEAFADRPAECRGPDGEPIPVKVSAAPLTDPEGRRTGTVLLIRDVRELRSVEEQLERSRRLAALGRMAAGLAHEIRNPLGTLRGFAQYLGARGAGEARAAEYAGLMVTEIDRLDRLIGALLQFARPRDPEVRDLALAPLAERTAALVRADVEAAGLSLRVEVPDGLEVRADPDLLTQVLLNLAQNAVAATDPGGEVAIAARTGDGWVGIAVDDTGRGLTREERGHMFDPFYTTRRTGTGLGLAVVHQIVEQHGGRIEVESIQGRGTRITVWLPAADRV